MTLVELKRYLKNLRFTSFDPSFVTIHHTANPDLNDRTKGFSAQHLLNLKHHYEEIQGWPGAPHFFVDDRGIIVFQELNKRGVHAKSFNRNSWGIEMLGNYDSTSDFLNKRAEIIFQNTAELVALLCEFKGFKPDSLKFHRDDPKTTKTCPGKLILKKPFVERVEAEYNKILGEDVSDWSNPIFRIKYYDTEVIWDKTKVVNNRTLVPIRKFLDTVTPKYSKLIKIGKKVYWNIGLSVYSTQVAEVDENGASWVYLRDVCNVLNASFEKI
jgi:hypothetical protein